MVKSNGIYKEVVYLEKKNFSKDAIVATVFSAIGLIIFWWLGIAGIGMGIRAITNIKKNNEKGMALAIIGIVIGCADVVLYFVGTSLKLFN